MEAIIINEDFKDHWYKDSVQKPTLGIGFEVTSFIEELKASNDEIKNKFAVFILSGNYLKNMDFDSFYNNYFKNLSLENKMKYLEKLPNMK